MRLYEINKIPNKKTLYVCRHLLNTDDITNWAKKQGFKTCLPDEKFHVTVVYSKKEIEWEYIKPKKTKLIVKNKNSRELCKFGKDKDTVVLLFVSKTLSKRHKELLAVGCSSDFPEYKAHISITYDGTNIDISKMSPYRGKLIFGPEEFYEINEDFSNDFDEQKLK